MTNNYEKNLKSWIEDEKSAIELISTIGHLWLDKSIEVTLFRNQLIDRKVSEILSLHQYSKDIVKKPITVQETLNVAKAMAALNLAPSKIDIGTLTANWTSSNQNIEEYLSKALSQFMSSSNDAVEPRDVVLYGFGRIGRIAARELISQAGSGKQLRLRAIVTRTNSDDDLRKRAELLRRDSVHGPFPGTIVEDFENKALVINGHTIIMIAAAKPEEIDYTAFGINNALLIDNTGAWRDREGLNKHLLGKGIAQVLLTAPGKGDIPNIVFGVNHNTLDLENEKIFSAASCTTNAIVPVISVMENKFGIEKGHIETIHSYTNDQNLLDNYHKKYRRGRSAALNMVITETGAGKAVTKAIPAMAGKLTANAVRVPTPNGSLAVMSLNLNRETSVEEINEIVKDAALNGALVEQIYYSFSNELVSTDIIGNSCPSVFDSAATIVSNDKKSAILYVWYDNEYGYTRQVMRMAKFITKVRRPTNY